MKRLLNLNNFSHRPCISYTKLTHWNLLHFQTQIKTSKKKIYTHRKSHRINELTRTQKEKKKTQKAALVLQPREKQKNSRNAFRNEDQTEAISTITDLEHRNGKRRGQASKHSHWSQLDHTHSGTPARILR